MLLECVSKKGIPMKNIKVWIMMLNSFPEIVSIVLEMAISFVTLHLTPGMLVSTFLDQSLKCFGCVRYILYYI